MLVCAFELVNFYVSVKGSLDWGYPELHSGALSDKKQKYQGGLQIQ